MTSHEVCSFPGYIIKYQLGIWINHTDKGRFSARNSKINLRQFLQNEGENGSMYGRFEAGGDGLVKRAKKSIVSLD